MPGDLNIGADLVKRLREKTGAGIMDCKKALQETGGDLERATDQLRRQGITKAAAKSQRTTKEGLIGIRISPDQRFGVILELNCETDFVARTEEFQALRRSLLDRAERLFAGGGASALSGMQNDESSREMTDAVIAKLGENINLRRLSALSLPEGGQGKVGAYLHAGDKLGVLVALEADHISKEAQFDLVLKDLSMQIAAANPTVVSRDQLPPETVQREEAIYRQQAEDQGKPEKIVERIVNGKLEKYYQEVCLTEQSFIKDEDKTIRELLEETARGLGGEMKVQAFLRFRVGESAE